MTYDAALARDFEALYQYLRTTSQLEAWLTQVDLSAQVEHALYGKPHGKRAEWLETLAQLPPVTPSEVSLGDTVRIGAASDLSATQQIQLRDVLESFIPWRKGPFELFGLGIDTEWRSDWKWQRVVPHLAPLAGRKVLDVGCGSGYHLWRMREAGASLALGLDPSLFFLMQFHCVKLYMPQAPVHCLPLRSEDLPDLGEKGFDSVFSMGVLYHRRSPLAHLQELKQVLRPGGELVLETLVVEGDAQTVLMPEARYAKMRNVWFIPSVALLELWLRRLGFVNIRTVDVNRTSVAEQRSTDWMRFESLCDFLDPSHSERTIEGYPAPTRAVVVAEAPR